MGSPEGGWRLLPHFIVRSAGFPFHLMEGLRLPETAWTTPEGVDMENHAVQPDIAVENRPEDLHAILLKAYANEPFVHVLPFGAMPQTRHVRGSNMTFVGIARDRVAPRAIICSALDNLVKGASGQAVQNMNLMLGLPETTGLDQMALFP